jgi:SAM-dependent methyltransferase
VCADGLKKSRFSGEIQRAIAVLQVASMTLTDKKEARKPPSNSGAGSSALNRCLFLARKALDLQLSSVINDIRPWLGARMGRLLEVGCGNQPYRSFLPPSVRYTGLDWKEAHAGFDIEALPDVIYYDGTRFPLPDAAFDSILHTEVLEHVADFTTFLSECFRVLRPGGEMILTVPFQARFHYIPHDYWRFTPSGLSLILTHAGFTDISIRPRGTDVVVAAYKMVSVFYRMAYGGLAGKIVFVLCSWLVLLLLIVAHLCLIFKIGSIDDCIGYTATAHRPAASGTSADAKLGGAYGTLGGE